MSWLAKSFANLIATEDDDDGGDGVEHRGDGGKRTPGDAAEVLSPAAESNEEDGSGEADLGRGVKEDLSELSKTLTRQFWGVASFLAPPPASSPSPSSPSSADGDASHDLPHPSVSPDSADSPKIGGIRSDFAEIGGRFRSGISKLSSAKAVSEISKIASSFLQLTSDGEEEEMEDEHELEKKLGSRGIAAIGVTDEVLTFAQNISMHPETWLDFPLFSDDDATDDFDMSDAQQEHALAVERLVPRLAALRIELCPGHISEGCFWKIYFVLLHPRLNKNDAELLSTPQIVEARALLLQDLQSRTKSPSGDWSSSSRKKEDAPPFEGDDSSADLETEKHTVAAAEVRVVDKAVIEEDAPVYRRKEALPAMDVPPAAPLEKFEDNGDEWLEDESPAGIGGAKISSVAIADDEDVSFSDLEEEDEKTQAAAAPPPPTSSNAGKPIAAKAPEEANEWSDLEDLDVV